MQCLIDSLRNRSIAVVAIALVALQFSMVTHELLEEHSLGEHCVICVAQDRFDDDAALAAAPNAVILAVARSSSIASPTIAFNSAAVSAVRNRGPPVL